MEKLKINLNILNKDNKIISENKISKNILFFLSKKITKKFNIEIGIKFVSAKKIQKLNLKHRNKNKPTNVLSFPIYKNLKQINDLKTKNINLGDIFICKSIAQKEAFEQNIALEDYIYMLIIHSLKHLIGIHHKE